VGKTDPINVANEMMNLNMECFIKKNWENDIILLKISVLILNFIQKEFLNASFDS